jgi:hypothetical protein
MPAVVVEPPVRVTIAEVARKEGVSMATIIRVINRPGHLQPETIVHMRTESMNVTNRVADRPGDPAVEWV